MTYTIYSAGGGWYVRTQSGAGYVEVFYAYRPGWHRSALRTIDFLNASPVMVAKNVVFK